eukprot:TRINITY_DN28264_c0_g1_i1.p1 TRINITY_DN28264_c0_g1~~TRINITY_DN28264_c0_g1_i1.p1  ORF type:complete len:385 (-),score=-82.46 TRINITY_DN28264_c0_g1_i1:96-1250(-)
MRYYFFDTPFPPTIKTGPDSHISTKDLIAQAFEKTAPAFRRPRSSRNLMPERLLLAQTTARAYPSLGRSGVGGAVGPCKAQLKRAGARPCNAIHAEATREGRFLLFVEERPWMSLLGVGGWPQLLKPGGRRGAGQQCAIVGIEAQLSRIRSLSRILCIFRQKNQILPSAISVATFSVPVSRTHGIGWAFYKERILKVAKEEALRKGATLTNHMQKTTFLQLYHPIQQRLNTARLTCCEMHCVTVSAAKLACLVPAPAGTLRWTLSDKGMTPANGRQFPLCIGRAKFSFFRWCPKQKAARHWPMPPAHPSHDHGTVILSAKPTLDTLQLSCGRAVYDTVKSSEVQQHRYQSPEPHFDGQLFILVPTNRGYWRCCVITRHRTHIRQ